MKIKTGLTTGVGSMPDTDKKEAIKKILDTFSIPYWPQLPYLSYNEGMYIQYSDNMPAACIDTVKEKLYFDSNRVMEDVEKVYMKYMEEDIDYFKVNEDKAQGLFEFLATAPKSEYVKGQIIGPISFGLTVTDENDKAVLYNEMLFDGILKTLEMKIKWQIRELKKISDNVIIYLDEPYLASFGSAYVSIQEEDVLKYLNATADVIINEGAVPGVHCCGNSDFALLTKTRIQIHNFDSYGFGQSIVLYPDEMNSFFNRDGVIAWGIVPTSDKIMAETAESIKSILDKIISEMDAKGIK
ncbi:MAG: hypothetical protein KAS39_09040, partial [Actinomycetia bacterium]|nr:hypothetical protein [Actinomycetes bacterium]